MRRTFILLIVALVVAAVSMAAPKKKRKDEPLALISGTVFQYVGFSFPGAKVSVVSQKNPKIKADTVAGLRGEFTLRVPAAGGPYTVRAEAKGFTPEEKAAEVYEGTKTTITFRLKPTKEDSEGK
jgi:hypothetical protein